MNLSTLLTIKVFFLWCPKILFLLLLDSKSQFQKIILRNTWSKKEQQEQQQTSADLSQSHLNQWNYAKTLHRWVSISIVVGVTKCMTSFLRGIVFWHFLFFLFFLSGILTSVATFYNEVKFIWIRGTKFTTHFYMVLRLETQYESIYNFVNHLNSNLQNVNSTQIRV